MADNTTQEQIKKLQEEEQKRANFAADVQNALKLFDPSNIRSKTLSTYSRETLRTYLQNPATDSNNKNLRKLSNYLYTVSHVYRRMINFKAHQIKCDAWTVYPVVSMVEENNPEQVLKEYERVTRIVDNMNMKSQIYKLMLSAWKTDVAFGYIYGDPETDGDFFIHLLDPDYCKISTISYDSGVLGFLFDMSYFGTYAEQLEYYDPEFERLYKEYQKDNVRWKQLPIEKTFCIKINIDNLDYPVVPLSGLLESVISLTDLQAAQDDDYELQTYKMLWGKLDTLSGTKEPNDFSVDLKLAVDFMSKIQGVLPENVGIALSPMDLNTIDFKHNDAADTNMLSEAYSNLIEANGSVVLNSNRITNATSFKMAMKAEAEDAMAPVDQINAWINFYLKHNHNVENMVVEYSKVSPYFIDDYIDKLLKGAQYGLPVKTELASLYNANPNKAHGMDYLERELLGLGTKRWTNTLQSSNTQSSNGGGAPTVEESGREISDEGQDTRDQDKNDQ